MSRRGRSGPTISLFSFQDIITSVTAIVTVIALLLALDLVQKKQAQSNDSSATLAGELVERLKQAEIELAKLQTMATSNDELVREVAATSPAELKNEIAERESTIVELEREKARLEQQAAFWTSREKEKLAEQFDLEPLKNELVQVDRSTQELERQLAEEQSDNRTIFTLPRGFQKEGWIAEIEAGQITVAPLGRPAKPTTFAATGLAIIGSSATDNFESWINKHNLRSAYFLVLIRPEAEAEFENVHKMLSNRSIAFGFDLIDADQPVLHPERGAAP